MKGRCAVADQRRLLATCLRRVVLKPGALELHVPASPLLLGAGDGGDALASVSSWLDSAPAGGRVTGPRAGKMGVSSRAISAPPT